MPLYNMPSMTNQTYIDPLQLTGNARLTFAEQILQLVDPLDLTLPESSLINLSQYREQSRAQLTSLEVPSQQVEEWKYTPVRSQLQGLLQAPLPQDAGAGVGTSAFGAHIATTTKASFVKRIVLVNGVYMPTFSDNLDQSGIVVTSFVDALDKGLYSVSQFSNAPKEYFTVFNEVGGGRGLYIHFGKDADPQILLHIDHIFQHTAAALVNTRNVIRLSALSTARIVETTTYENPGVHNLHNAFTEVDLAAGANCHHVLIQKGTDLSTAITRENVDLSRDSSFSMHTYTLSGRFTRNDVRLNLNEPGADGHMFGFYQPGGAELCDNHTLADHRAPNCTSNELYKGILRGKSIGVFNGKVFVHPNAQKTNAYQQNDSIILEDEATMNSKPELEIYADDVKCSHGSTIGQLDEAALFYLRSRGIGYSMSKALLIQAFAQDVISNLTSEAVAEYLATEIL